MLGKCDGEVEEEEKGARARAGEKVARYASSEHKSGVAHGPAGCTLRPRRDQAVWEAMRRRIRICTHTSVESALSSAAAAAAATAAAAASGARREGRGGEGRIWRKRKVESNDGDGSGGEEATGEMEEEEEEGEGDFDEEEKGSRRC